MLANDHKNSVNAHILLSLAVFSIPAQLTVAVENIGQQHIHCSLASPINDIDMFIITLRHGFLVASLAMTNKPSHGVNALWKQESDLQLSLLNLHSISV